MKRKNKAALERLSKRIDPELDLLQLVKSNDWPDHHIILRTTCKNPMQNGMSIMRFLFTQIYGPYSSKVRAIKECKTQFCINPDHYRLQSTYDRKLESYPDLPEGVTQIIDHDEVNDLVLLLKEQDPRTWELPVTKMRMLVNPDFNEEEYKEALRRLKSC